MVFARGHQIDKKTLSRPRAPVHRRYGFGMCSRTSVAARASLGRGFSAVVLLDSLPSWMLDGSHRRPGSHADILSCRRGCARGHACGACRARPQSGGGAAPRQTLCMHSPAAQKSSGRMAWTICDLLQAGHSSTSLELGPGVPTRRDGPWSSWRVAGLLRDAHGHTRLQVWALFEEYHLGCLAGKQLCCSFAIMLRSGCRVSPADGRWRGWASDQTEGLMSWGVLFAWCRWLGRRVGACTMTFWNGEGRGRGAVTDGSRAT
jgi:hypothetical protein